MSSSKEKDDNGIARLLTQTDALVPLIAKGTVGCCFVCPLRLLLWPGNQSLRPFCTQSSFKGTYYMYTHMPIPQRLDFTHVNHVPRLPRSHISWYHHEQGCILSTAQSIFLMAFSVTLPGACHWQPVPAEQGQGAAFETLKGCTTEHKASVLEMWTTCGVLLCTFHVNQGPRFIGNETLRLEVTYYPTALTYTKQNLAKRFA